jgi:hypothetical protein
MPTACLSLKPVQHNGQAVVLYMEWSIHVSVLNSPLCISHILQFFGKLARILIWNHLGLMQHRHNTVSAGTVRYDQELAVTGYRLVRKPSARAHNRAWALDPWWGTWKLEHGILVHFVYLALVINAAG